MKESSFTFYVENFRYIKSLAEANVEFLSPIVRRRLSNMDKCTLYLLNEIYSEDAQNLVFSSRYGEVDRLNKIIAQYTEADEVSPNTFAGSVHNYSAGFFLLNKQKTIPYNAIAARTQPISSGILAVVCSQFNKTLFCYSDVYAQIHQGFGLFISKTPTLGASEYKITMKNVDNTSEDNFLDYIDLFSGRKTSICTPLFMIERVENVK